MRKTHLQSKGLQVRIRKQGGTRKRWQAAGRGKAFEIIRRLSILETGPEHFLRVLELVTVATNVFLRRLHNFALAVTWFPWPALNRQQMPRVHHCGRRSGHSWRRNGIRSARRS